MIWMWDAPASLELPGVKNTPQSTKIAGDDGTISDIVTKRVLGEEGRHHPQQQDSQPLPKTPPNMPCIVFCVVKAHSSPNARSTPPQYHSAIYPHMASVLYMEGSGVGGENILGY